MPAAAVMSGRPAGCRAVGGYCRPSPDLARRFSARPTAEALSAASLAKPTQQRSTDGEKSGSNSTKRLFNTSCVD